MGDGLDCGEKRGTNTGYKRHMNANARRRAAGETAVPSCQECRDVRAAWQRDYEKRRVLLRSERVMVSSLGTRRRLQALAVMGWAWPELSRRLGSMSPSSLSMIMRAPRVKRESAEKIRALYDEVSMVPGESAVAVTRAVRKGWAPPLAWDDIDDPAETPSGMRLRPRPRVDSAGRAPRRTGANR